MEKTLNSLLSLEEISLRRVAVHLWSQSDILHSLDELSVESVVESNIKKLQLPTKLSERMRFIVKPIGMELKNWKKFHEGYTFNPNINMTSISKHLWWTTSGTLDYRKTAETLIRHETFDDDILYLLACLYCLDEYIPVLWEKLDENCKTYYYIEKGPVKFDKPKLEFCWPYILKGEETRLSFTEFGNDGCFNLNLFKYSAYKGNKAATEYFLQKLPNDIRGGLLKEQVMKVRGQRLERELVILNRDHHLLERDEFPEVKVDDVLLYLLSLMNLEQQIAFYSIDLSDRLRSLLEWPQTYRFLGIMDLYFWQVIDDYEYSSVLSTISRKMKAGYHLSNLFQEFFLRGSSDFKNYILNPAGVGDFAIENLIEIGDTESLKLIFRNVDLASKKSYICSIFGFDLFYNSISVGKWHLVELFFRGVTLSKEDKEGIKETYAVFVREMDALNTETWETLLNIIDGGEVRVLCKRKSDKDYQLKKRKKNCIEE